MSPRPSLTFLGGAGTVTGSKFLIEHGSGRILVDCGLSQGLREDRRRNWRPLPVDPAGIDAVVVTHAHLDHCGYLPRLVREGFAGPVLCTPETAQLAAIVLRDSAKLQEEDAEYARAAQFSRHDPPLPLYDRADAEKAIALFCPTRYGVATDVAGANVRLRPTGHILGSASASVRVAGHSIVVSGDLGRQAHPLLAPPVPPDEADVVLVESTYGDRRHERPDPDRLASVVRRTIRRGGTVLIPAFAVDRTEIVLRELRRLTRAGEIPAVPVYVDSPMALAALEVYQAALRAGADGVRSDLTREDDPFDPGHLRVAHSAEESARLNTPASPCIILSASGMATGGRVVHHLKYQLPDPRNTVVLVGYQVPGTRGRALVDGARQLKMHGRYVPVRAEVVDLPEFSVHADADETIAWLSAAPRQPKACYVVHGEPAASSALAERINTELGWLAVVPRDGEKVRVE
jgi:metallo-beta-lactamase family protein